MRDIHAWNLLAVDVPNILPKSVPWFDFSWHHGFTYSRSTWMRHAGRLLWASLIFIIGLIGAIVVMRRPKKSNEPATWVQSILGAMYVFAMFTLIYGVMPSEWIIFGNSYLNFDTTTFIVRKGQWAHGGHFPPFDVTRSVFVETVAALFYVVGLGLTIALFVAWQKRKVIEPASEDEIVDADAEPKLSPLGRLRARREQRVSAYGRPVTTTTDS